MPATDISIAEFKFSTGTMSEDGNIASSPVDDKRKSFKALVRLAVQQQVDPWAKFEIEKLPIERVRRHRYQPRTGKWLVDESFVKVQSVPFDAGAMREVYRMKKISQVDVGSQHWHKINWSKAPNYVLKGYKSDRTEDGKFNVGLQEREKYFSDIKLQYEAAHWADEYNHHNPPKQIHVIQCFVLEFFEREGTPIYGCERFVDGHDKYG